MFFDDTNQIPEIAKRCGTSIFVIPDNCELSIKNAIILSPEQKSVISIEQVRDVLHIINNKQFTDQFIVIRPADKMSDAAFNAILKSLEEPTNMIHFVLVTENIGKILPTVLSRASIYFLKTSNCLSDEIVVDDKVKDLAKQLLVAKPNELVAITDQIARKKDGIRGYALLIIGTAIEILYKSYFATSKEVFLKKLPKFLMAYDGISRNGHVKLQLLANLC